LAHLIQYYALFSHKTVGKPITKPKYNKQCTGW